MDDFIARLRHEVDEKLPAPVVQGD